MHSGIWQSLTRSRRLIPGGLGDRHPHASALTGRTESSLIAELSKVVDRTVKAVEFEERLAKLEKAIAK